MYLKTLLKLDAEEVIRRIEEILNIKLPEKILEISLLPENGILYIKFKETLEKEIGEPVHPLIHIFKDEKGYITALEIIDLNKIMQAKTNTLKI